MKKIIYKYLIAPFFFLVIYLISTTLKFEFIREDGSKYEEEVPWRDNAGRPIILVFWHGRMFICPYIFRKVSSHYAILVSPSVDGDIVAQILNLFGFKCIRGSSYKEGIKAYYQLRKSIKNNLSLAIIADGSRGPVYKMQSGALHLSRTAGVGIVPITFQAERKYVFKSWDNFIFPFPFSRVIISVGKSRFISEESPLEEAKSNVESTLNDITREVDNYFLKGVKIG